MLLSLDPNTQHADMASRYYGGSGGSRTATKRSWTDDEGDYDGLSTGPIYGKRRLEDEDDSYFSDTPDIDGEEDEPCVPDPDLIRQPSPRRIPSTSTASRSPSRGVRFGRGSKIETGPTPSNPSRTQQPLRSAMSPERSMRSASTTEGPEDRLERIFTTNRHQQESASSSSRKPGPDLVSLSESDRDDMVCKLMHNLRDLIWAFAGEVLRDLHPKLAARAINIWLCDVDFAPAFRYIGMLALGGPRGRADWDELMADKQCLQALILGVVGRALKEHVFGALWFGGSEKEIGQLETLEAKGAEMDGTLSSFEAACHCTGP